MNELDIRELLEAVGTGKLSPGTAMERLKHMPFEDIGFAKVDHHRALRQGFAEVVFGKGKTPRQVAEIVRAMVEKRASRQNVLVTRADEKMFAAVKRVSRAAKFHVLSKVITIERSAEITGKGVIVVVSAGTSDIPVAEEAVLTARMMGNRVEQVYDVGVAGIHRLLDHRGKLNEARVIVCVAERGRRIGGCAGDCGAYEHRIWSESWRSGGAAGDAEFVRVERDGGEYR
jgi:NCAIR mutase (PurE)-related protein